MQQSGKQTSSSVMRYQQAIGRVRGVIRSTVVLENDGRIAEVHVIADQDRPPKRIVRDIESLLAARFGVRIDFRKVSLVQLDPEDEAESPLRLCVGQAKMSDGQVTVVLSEGEQRYSGSSDCDKEKSESRVAAATAEATLQAVEQAMGGSVKLQARDAQVVDSRGDRVCLQIVQASTPRGDERLSGTCIVAQDLREAACKATLDALNRRLPAWLSDRGPSRRG